MSLPSDLPSPTLELRKLRGVVMDLLQSAVLPDQGLLYIEALLSQAQQLNARWEQVALQILLARYHVQHAQGQGLGFALGILEPALVQARQLGDPSLTVRILSSMVNALHRQGRYSEALVAFMECAQLASGMEDPHVRFLVLNNTAAFHLSNGSYAEGMELLEQAQQAAHESGDLVGGQITVLCRLAALNSLGHHQQVLDLAGGLDVAGLPPQFRLIHLNNMVAALNGLSREGEALTRAREAQELAEQSGNSRWQGEARAVMAQTLLQLGRLPEALQLALEANAHLNAEYDPDSLLQNQRRLATLHEALGQPDQALAWLKKYQHGESDRLKGLLSARSAAFAMQARVNALEAQAATERLKNAELSRVIHELHRAEDALEYQSTHDPLTGLRNRVSFQKRAQVLLNTLPEPQQAAMIFIDLDNFKGVNDLYGHAAGDDLLRQVAHRLTSVRPEGLAGRMGGDEFVLLLPVADGGEAGRLAGEMLRLLARPFFLSTGDRVEIGGSAGVALAPTDGREADLLQHRADQAMYASKRRTGGGVQFYSVQLGQAREARLRLESDLRSAVRSGELRLHYQASYDAPSGCLHGFEALVRWQRPGLGLISPHAFIPVAEHSQSMVGIGTWVLEEACRQAATWNLAARHLTLAVNVSVVQFQQPDFVQVVQDVLDQTGCAARALTIELTETVILKDLEHARTSIEALRRLGVQVSMDDFGTGYSSLSVLRHLPLNFLKIDRSFMHGIPQPQGGRKAEVMLATIVDLAHQLGMQVTAEGVETPEQLAFLKGIGCDRVQGFLLGRPESAEQAAQRLA